MLYDKAQLYVKAGSGGDGSVSFRHEAHVPRGGPDGGDGGDGGDVKIYCDSSQRDLQNVKRHTSLKAESGGRGDGSKRHGHRGKDIVVRVPPGTQVRTSNGVEYDLTVPGTTVTIAKGGTGGRGNKYFTTSTRQTPRFAERGLPGEECTLNLQLKLIADVGFIGLPNAGKSSMLARVTDAKPKIGSYPFTTLEPQLGTVSYGEKQLVLADVPGLIEGASDGVGLGHEFLAHVERTSLLVHVLDAAPLDGSDPVTNYETVEAELKKHSPRLASRPRILALSKADLLPLDTVEEQIRKWQKRLDCLVIATSTVTGYGLDDLVRELFHRTPEQTYPAEVPNHLSGEEQDEENTTNYKVFKPKPANSFSVERVGEGVFKASGSVLDSLVARFDSNNYEAMIYLEKKLQRLGVIKALEREGFVSGNTVDIAGQEFELHTGR